MYFKFNDFIIFMYFKVLNTLYTLFTSVSYSTIFIFVRDTLDTLGSLITQHIAHKIDDHISI